MPNNSLLQEMVLAEDHKLRQTNRIPPALSAAEAVHEFNAAVEAIGYWLTGPHPKHRVALARLHKIISR